MQNKLELDNTCSGNNKRNYAEVTPESGWGYCTNDCRCKIRKRKFNIEVFSWRTTSHKINALNAQGDKGKPNVD